MIRCLPELQRQAPGIHIIHQTGERDYNDALAAYQSVRRSGVGGSIQVYRRHAGGVCAGGSGGVPVGREHGGGNYGGGKAGDFCAVSAGGGRSSAGECRGAGAVRVRRWWWRSRSWREFGWRRRLRLCWGIRGGCEMSEAARELAHPNAARDIAAMAARWRGSRTSHGFARISRILLKFCFPNCWFIREFVNPWLN